MGSYGLLGRTLAHSYSPQIHAFLGNPDYSLLEKEPEQLGDFLKNGDWKGLNVTIPYKKAVLPYCDRLDPTVEALGNANCLVKSPDGSIFAANTDALGFRVLLGNLDCTGKKALVLGSGGASQTASAVLRQCGAKVVQISRSGPENYENLDRHKNAKILVNATPVGMYPDNDRCPVDLDRLPQLERVLDLVYNPARTRLLTEAKKRGISCEGGLLMLVVQAAQAETFFLGKAYSMPEIHSIRQKIAREMENIILIGMPGCGKTTLGTAIAKKLGRPFYDSDEEFLKTYGISPKACIESLGEPEFRQRETALLKTLGARSGSVIATGGGCVTRAENEVLLRQNGRIFLVHRPLEQLDRKDRPLSSDLEAVKALFRQRQQAYHQFSDAVLDNDRDISDALNEFMEKWSK